MIHMRGVKASYLEGIMDFIYLGETHVQQEDLAFFLSLCEDLQLEGLADLQNDGGCVEQEVGESSTQNDKSGVKIEYNESTTWHNVFIGDTATVNIQEDLRAKMNAMVEKIGPGNYRCKVCGKTSKDKRCLRYHTETHLEGTSHPCNQCGKVFKTQNSITVHMSKYHRK
jgi:hypothetical protein